MSTLWLIVIGYVAACYLLGVSLWMRLRRARQNPGVAEPDR
jgi:hypothetical protein